MPGPLPDPNARRRNAPTIPTTRLPAGGRKGKAPKVPNTTKLGTAGRRWWRWAWGTPQAAAWEGGGFEANLAMRASLEDDLDALQTISTAGLAELLGADREGAGELRALLKNIAAQATGRLAIVKQMQAIDTDLGLTPKGMAALRWQVIAEEETAASSSDDELAKRRQQRRAAAIEADEPKAKAKAKPKAKPKAKAKAKG